MILLECDEYVVQNNIALFLFIMTRSTAHYSQNKRTSYFLAAAAAAAGKL